VLLIIEQDVESAGCEVVQLKLKRHLTENWAFFVEERVNVQNLNGIRSAQDCDLP
jgi:hypothetical protein